MAALTAGKDELVAGMRASKYTGLATDYGWEIIAGPPANRAVPAMIGQP